MNGFQIGTKRLKVQHKRIVSINQSGEGEKNFASDNTSENHQFSETLLFEYPQDQDFRR